MNDFQKAIQLAQKAHRGQLDKAGQDYLLHPLRVAQSVETEEEKIVAVLHDVLEDSDVQAGELRKNGFSENIIEALILLRHKKGESYAAYITRLSVNELARKVKIADLHDNMNLNRLPQITEKDRERNAKYAAALEFLMGESQETKRLETGNLTRNRK